MPHRKKQFEAGLKRLLGSAAMGVYLEPEQKLDARDESVLKDVESYIVDDPYFELLNTNHLTCDVPPGIHISSDLINGYPVEYARQVTPRRFRLYYDTPMLDGFHCGVEVRIEHPGPTEHGHKKPFKQVVKIGGPATSKDHTFHRIEISGRIASSIPSFEAETLDGNGKLAGFLSDSLDVANFRPLQLLATVRTRIWCRPDGDANTIVEFGIDRGRGITFDGHQYSILQIEPELIHGDPAALNDVSDKLMERFSGALTVNLTSKPTPGYNHLAAVLKDDKVMRHAARRLKVPEFNLLAAPR